jgi:hypothetical protein
MFYLGDFPEDATVYIPFNTFTSDDPSESCTITDLAPGDIKVHKDGSTTEISTDGATVTINFDSVTGNHLVAIDTSVDAAYATGSDYCVRMEGTTVDGATVNAWIGHFSIENRTAFPKADFPSNFSALGIESDGDLTKVNELDGHTAQTGDNYAIVNGDHGLVSIQDDVDAILADTNELQTDNIPGTLSTIDGKIDTVDTVADGIQTDLSNATDGLGALKTLIDALPTASEIQEELEEDGASILDTLRDDLADGGRLDLLIDAIKAKTDNLPADPADDSDIDSQLSTIDGKIDALNDLSAADVNAEVDTALADYDPPTKTEMDTAFTEIKGATWASGTDTLEAIRDRGDAAWVTGGGGAISQSLNVQPVLPFSIDLANTATVRLGLVLVNALDDLPSTAEITPGTIDIDRKAIGGTSWTSVVSGAAMSEQAGMVYYDEVFDSATGYAEGDSIRITFKSVSITADANAHEVCDSNGLIFQTSIRETMRGTDSANTTTPPTAVAIRTEIDSNSTQLAAIVADTNELQTDDIPGTLTTIEGKIDAVDTVADAIKAKTDNLPTDPADDSDIDTQLSSISSAISALNDVSTAEVNSQCDLALSDYDPPTRAELTSDISGLETKIDTIDTVVDSILSLLDDARSEPGDGAPPVNADAVTKLDYLYKFMRNKIETTATKIHVYDDAGTNKDHTATISDDGTTATRGEFGAGE